MRAVAHVGRDAFADEARRTVDAAMRGPLPELVGRAVVEHRVVERIAAAAVEARAAQLDGDTAAVDGAQVEEVARRLLANPAFERLILDAARSSVTTRVADELTRSPAFKQMLTNIVSAPEVRHALERQTAGFGDELAAAARARARAADDSVAARFRRRGGRATAPQEATRYAGIGTRGSALALDAIIVNAVFLLGSGLVGLVASLVGSIRPAWLVGVLAAVAWAVAVTLYFACFWATIGQTPGMRLMGVRVVAASGEAPSGFRSVARVVGLVLAIIPLFAGFLPALVDGRRRALPDYLAGTTVVYD